MTSVPPPARDSFYGVQPLEVLGKVEVVGGLLVALAAHTVLPGLVLLLAMGINEVAGAAAPARPDHQAEREIVEARFVQLGKRLDPRKLPNRQVPRLSTAPSDAQAVSKRPQDRARPDAGPPPPNATEDLLRRLGDRAQVFAEIAEERDREGDPEGIEQGSATARIGDLYAGRLYAFFRRGWTVPTVISQEERRTLVTDVDVAIGQDLTVQSFRVRRSSGNPLFDQSVADRLETLVQAAEAVPPPPEEVAAQYVGKTLGLRFHGRDAN